MAGHSDYERRTVLEGTVALGITMGLAGCSSVPLIGDDDDGSSDVDLSYGDTIEGEIVEDGPRDPYYNDLATPHTFEGSSGDGVRITLDSEIFDTHLLLVNSAEDVVAQNDDRAFGNLNSTIETTLPADDAYTIWAGSYSGVATGPYTLGLEER